MFGVKGSFVQPTRYEFNGKGKGYVCQRYLGDRSPVMGPRGLVGQCQDALRRRPAGWTYQTSYVRRSKARITESKPHPNSVLDPQCWTDFGWWLGGFIRSQPPIWLLLVITADASWCLRDKSSGSQAKGEDEWAGS